MIKFKNPLHPAGYNHLLFPRQVRDSPAVRRGNVTDLSSDAPFVAGTR